MDLVTGATGILGSHVLFSLAKRGHRVRAAKRPASDISRVQELFRYYSGNSPRLFDLVEWVDLDVLDYPAIEECISGVTNVYHCAGLVSFDPADRKRLFRVNEQGTRNIVNACLHAGNVNLCHASTIGTISNSDHPVLDESVFWKKSGSESDYALSKYGAEREVWRGIEEGLDAVIVNPGVIIAPVFWEQSSGRIFRKCFSGNPYYTTGSAAYISASDTAEAMISLTEGRHFGNRYILAEGNYDLRFILTRIQENFGRRPPLISVPKSVMYTMASLMRFFGIFTSKPPVLTKSLVNSAYNRQIYSNSKIKEVLGFSFEPVPDVLDKVCGYYRTVSAK